MSSYNWYTVNLTTGRMDAGRGCFAGADDPTGIAYNSDNGVMYGVSESTNSLYTVNLITGVWDAGWGNGH